MERTKNRRGSRPRQNSTTEWSASPPASAAPIPHNAPRASGDTTGGKGAYGAASSPLSYRSAPANLRAANEREGKPEWTDSREGTPRREGRERGFS